MNILNGLSHERFDMDMNQSKMLPQKWKLFSFYAERRSKCKLSKK